MFFFHQNNIVIATHRKINISSVPSCAIETLRYRTSFAFPEENELLLQNTHHINNECVNLGKGVRDMVFNATFNNMSVISWRSVLLVRETRGPAACHWQTLSHGGYIEYTSPWAGMELTTLAPMGTDCIGSFKSNYHTITATTAHVSTGNNIN